MGVRVGVLVGVRVGVLVEVLVTVVVGVFVNVFVGVLVGVFVGVFVMLVGVVVGVFVGVFVGVPVGVLVGVFVGVSVTLGVFVGVAVGDWQKVETVAGAAPPPLVSNSSVPKSPLVWIDRDCPALSWKELVAIGVPLSRRVQVPALVMFEPMLVMVNDPCASGVQLAESCIVGARVGVIVGVAVGDWQKVETVAGAAPPPLVSSSSVPKSPLVWIDRDCPALSWKELVAIGVPLSRSV